MFDLMFAVAKRRQEIDHEKYEQWLIDNNHKTDHTALLHKMVACERFAYPRAVHELVADNHARLALPKGVGCGSFWGIGTAYCGEFALCPTCLTKRN